MMPSWALAILVVCLPPLLVGTAPPARAQAPQPQQQTPSENALPNPGTNGAEQWAWNEMRGGRVANFHEHCRVRLDPRNGGDPRWRDDCRQISAAFLERVLTAEAWRAAPAHRGVRIVGARVAEVLDLTAARVAAEVWLNQTRFEDQVRLYRARFKGLLSLEGSAFERGVIAEGLHVGGNLFLRNGAAVRGGPLQLIGASVGGNLSMIRSAFERGVIAEGLHVGGNLFLRNGAAVRGGPLQLRRAKIGGNLEMSGSTFESSVEAEGLHVGGNILLNDGAEFREVPRLRFVRVEGGLNLEGAILPGLDLSGSVIDRDLQLDSADGPPPEWRKDAQQKDARLVLRNVRVGAVQDRRGAWPPGGKSLDLHGFTYSQLGGSYGSGEDAMLARPVDWYVDWLAHDPTFTHQPYQQLAGVFRAAGDPDRAEVVLYAARERERAEAWREGDYLHAAGLWLLKVAIGYGLGGGFFRILYWVAGFTALGAIVLWFSQEARLKGPIWCVWASLDHLLPIVELNKAFSDFLDDTPGRLKAWQLSYFAFHALTGYVLASFVVAGLAGLTQAK